MGLVSDDGDTSHEKLEELWDRYRERTKSYLTKVKNELEPFSWFCSAIYSLEDGVLAIVVSRDQSRLKSHDYDDLDVEIVMSIFRVADKEGTLKGVNLQIAMCSFGGEIVTKAHPSGFPPVLFALDDAEGIEIAFRELEALNPYWFVERYRGWLQGKSFGKNS